MFHKGLTRLVCQTTQQTKQDVFLLCHSHFQLLKLDHSILFQNIFLRGILTSSNRLSAQIRDEDRTRPCSLIVQKLLQKRVENKAEEKVIRSKNSPGDMLSRLENMTEEVNTRYENEMKLEIKLQSNESENLDGQGEWLPSDLTNEINDNNFLEDVVLHQVPMNKPKPSPLLGTEDQSVPASTVPCVGCGALLHCQHSTMPGFLPSERFKLLSESELRSSICQRCYYIQHCNAFMEVKSSPEDYAKIISVVKPTRSAVLMVVDVTDIHGSIVPNLMTYIGESHKLIIVGNKADLIAPDNPDYLVKTREAIKQACRDAGLKNIRKVILVSAKTGFGVERLINMLLPMYKNKADIFIVGTANAGKSSLFNILLASDYCKIRARSLIQRATVSVWPGTTLNLLKFPIMRPSSRTLALRRKRLSQEQALRKQMLKQMKEKKKLEASDTKAETWELKENVSTTDMRTQAQVEKDQVGAPWGQEVFAYKGGSAGRITLSPAESLADDVFDASVHSNSYWVYDTPGVINPEQTFNLLEPEECPFVQSVTMIQPRCVLLKPGLTLFISGMARLDYVQGTDTIMTTVHCGSDLPIRIVTTEEADQFYLENIGTEQLGIPMGGQERFERLPSLIGKEVVLRGDDDRKAVGDIQLSSIGWVSVAPRFGCESILRVYTPGRKGIYVRTPSLSPRFGAFKGKKISGTPFFWPRKVGSVMSGKPLPEDGGEL